MDSILLHSPCKSLPKKIHRVNFHITRFVSPIFAPNILPEVVQAAERFAAKEAEELRREREEVTAEGVEKFSSFFIGENGGINGKTLGRLKPTFGFFFSPLSKAEAKRREAEAPGKSQTFVFVCLVFCWKSEKFLVELKERSMTFGYFWGCSFFFGTTEKTPTFWRS